MRKHLCLCFATNLHLILTAGIQKDSAQNAGEGKKVKYHNTQGWQIQGRVTIETPDMGLWAAWRHMLSITINLVSARAVIKAPRQRTAAR